MGYYTRYELEQVKGDVLDEDVYKEELYSIVGYNPLEDVCKWYEYSGDMSEFSKLYPNVIFRLYGEGEEAGDIWHVFYKNGKAIFEDRLEVKLKEPDLSDL